jgi:hypothetical protein
VNRRQGSEESFFMGSISSLLLSTSQGKRGLKERRLCSGFFCGNLFEAPSSERKNLEIV